jgi:hypothetical protein
VWCIEWECEVGVWSGRVVQYTPSLFTLRQGVKYKIGKFPFAVNSRAKTNGAYLLCNYIIADCTFKYVCTWTLYIT